MLLDRSLVRPIEDELEGLADRRRGVEAIVLNLSFGKYGPCIVDSVNTVRMHAQPVTIFTCLHRLIIDYPN